MLWFAHVHALCLSLIDLRFFLSPTFLGPGPRPFPPKPEKAGVVPYNGQFDIRVYIYILLIFFLNGYYTCTCTS